MMINIGKYPHHIFWSYAPDASLPESVVVRHIILYGDLNDIMNLGSDFSLELIEQQTDLLAKNPRNAKRVNFLRKIVLAQ